MSILVETSITVAEEKTDLITEELKQLTEAIKAIPGGMAYRWTKDQVADEKPCVLLKSALGVPTFEGHNFIILSYWESADAAAAWEKAPFHQKLEKLGSLEIRKYEQVAEPNERQGLHDDRMQRDYFFPG